MAHRTPHKVWNETRVISKDKHYELYAYSG